jgi:ATP-dependent helicase/nuclease subunit A
MSLRINETLSEWAIAEENVLHKKLENLLGRAPDKIAIEAARKLFADVIDTPGRLKIMTIHAFCQSVLSRFPLEAKLTPGFQVAEERAAHDYLSQAKIQTFSSAAKDKTNPLFAALQNLSQVINEDQLSQLIGAIASERGQLDDILQKHFGIDGLYTALCQEMNVTPNQSPQSILATACEDTSFNRAVIKSAADAMAESTKTDAGNAKKIHDFLASNLETRIHNFETYKSAFLKQDGEIRAKLLGKKISDASPHLLDTMQKEALRLQTITDKIRSATAAALTRDLLLIGKDTLDHYEKIKAQHNMLDYEDLIFKTRDLMQNSGQWVHYKLDQGIDHILIDEAQDTNPEQWSIIEALCAEFFAAHSEQDTNRTIFTVGDEKQSIYSFQRASPEEFERMRSHFAEKITAATARWEKVDLNISFRSTKSVLASVDQIFADPAIRRGLGIGDINHEAFRRGQAGLVELWPLFENDTDNDDAGITWDPPITIQDQKSGSTKCAENIADQIATWIENKEIIESYNRPIEPRDILVLVRTRNAFVSQLMRALKSRNVPVGGLDRIVLNDQLAVQDMLAACDFALLPSDDLTLACLLKSPLIGIDEDTLFTLAHGRNESLWSAVQDTADPKITSYLRALIHKSRNLSPYAFLAELLQSPCPADDTSGWRAFQKRLGLDAYESLNELLNAAITFEFDHTASLQNFVQWQRAGAGDIKRENDDQDNHVRIMTVHGSKGLQAPIVFLPDTTSTPGLNPSQAGNRLLWPTQTGQALPLWAPRKDIEDSHFASAKDKVLDRLGEEYRRLLYVAMTRAEDRLYITGYKSKRDISEDCWYAICRQGLQTHNEIEKLEEGRLRLSNSQIKDADRKPKPKTEEKTASPIPEWMTKPAPTEPEPPAPLIPSRPAEVEPAAISPLQASDNYRFRRGNVTHKLLQFLPDLAPEKRRGSMETYLEAHANDLPQSVRTNIVEEIEKILNDPIFAPLFAENSRAEVPITGLLPDGRLISGQIDRLLITNDEIMIVDYKSNRPPPTDPKDIPQIYRNQLKAYADVLKSIYPERKLTCALLWTDGPNLMEIK